MDEGADVYGCAARGNEANGGGRWEGARGPGGQGARGPGGQGARRQRARDGVPGGGKGGDGGGSGGHPVCTNPRVYKSSCTQNDKPLPKLTVTNVTIRSIATTPRRPSSNSAAAFAPVLADVQILGHRHGAVRGGRGGINKSHWDHYTRRARSGGRGGRRVRVAGGQSPAARGYSCGGGGGGGVPLTAAGRPRRGPSGRGRRG